MNTCAIAGKIVSGPIWVGEGKVAKFTIATKYRFGETEGQEGVSYVPCTIFNSGLKFRKTLEEGKSLFCMGVGRVSKSSYEDKEGKVVYSTDVILNPGTVVIKEEK